MKMPTILCLLVMAARLSAADHTILFVDEKLTEVPPGKYHIRVHLLKATAYAITLLKT